MSARWIYDVWRSKKEMYGKKKQTKKCKKNSPKWMKYKSVGFWPFVWVMPSILTYCLFFVLWMLLHFCFVLILQCIFTHRFHWDVITCNNSSADLSCNQRAKKKITRAYTLHKQRIDCNETFRYFKLPIVRFMRLLILQFT